MKKFTCCVMLLCFLINNCGCTSKQPEEPVETGGIATGQSNTSVIVALPADLIGLHEEFDFEELRKEKDLPDVTKNADGTVTVEMSASQQNEVLNVIKDLIDNSINETLQDEAMAAYYSDIKVSADCTELQVYMPSGDEFSMFHTMSLLPVKILCMIYQAFSGAAEYGTNVLVIDHTTNAPITEYYFSSNDL